MHGFRREATGRRGGTMSGDDPRLSALRTRGIIASCGFGPGPGFDPEQIIEPPPRVLGDPCRLARRCRLGVRCEAEQIGEFVSGTVASGIGRIPMCAPGRSEMRAVVRARLVDHPVGAFMVTPAPHLRRIVPTLPADVEIGTARGASCPVTDRPSHLVQRAATLPAHELVHLRLRSGGIDHWQSRSVHEPTCTWYQARETGTAEPSRGPVHSATPPARPVVQGIPPSEPRKAAS